MPADADPSSTGIPLDRQLEQLRRFVAWLAHHHPEYRSRLFGISKSGDGREQLSFAFYKAECLLGMYTSYDGLGERLEDPVLREAFLRWLRFHAARG